ncbi:MAG: hypothetical protein M1831_006111 [Alyxoria varia]|nr:MAG: hypothetical protein M1831_006111 [Alyxoria varia]
MFTFTPLLGAQSESPAVQSLLEFDQGIKILIDVGWDDSFDAEKLNELERQVPTISLILLTHATVAHLGAYVHCCKHIPLFSKIPVYATYPVISLGRTLLQDVYNSNPLAASSLPSSIVAELAYTSVKYSESGQQSLILLPPPSNDEIATHFSRITPLKFSQSHEPAGSPFSPPLDSLTITAFAAGHTLGGTIWHLQYGSESVVYAVDWNHARENLLAGAAWLGAGASSGAEIIEQLRSPTALICSSKGAESVGIQGGWKNRDNILLTHVQSAIKDGGSVLIPCDSSARALELAFVLERAWAEDPTYTLINAKLYMASRTSTTTMRFARSMLEWMDDTVVRDFETRAATRNPHSKKGAEETQPFDLKFLQLLERKTQISRALNATGPKVFIASDSFMQWGFSKDIIASISQDPKNLLILTDRCSANNAESRGYLSQQANAALVARIGSSASTEIMPGIDESVEVPTATVSALGAVDLPLYQQYLTRQRQKFNASSADKETNTEVAAEVVDEGMSSSSESDDDDDPEKQGKALNTSTTINQSKQKLESTDEELGINVLLRRKRVHDFNSGGRRGREKVLPFIQRRKRTDEHGGSIRAEDYLRTEERENAPTQSLPPDHRKGDTALGQKRRWDNKRTGKQDRAIGPNGTGKRRKLNDRDAEGEKSGANGNITADEDSEESDYEPAEPTIVGPRKAHIGTESMKLALKFAFIDFNGLHDKRTLQMVISLIRPQKLILTGGTEHETTSLLSESQKVLEKSSSSKKPTDYFAPTIGSSVNASIDTNAWTIKLSRPLLKTLKWQDIRGLGLVTMNAQLSSDDPDDPGKDTTSSKRLKLGAGDKSGLKNKPLSTPEKTIPVLGLIPSSLVTSISTFTKSLHVGDLRLSELRRSLQQQGHTAEFKGEGTLLVDGITAVRKSGLGHVEVESALSGASAIASKRHIATLIAVKKTVYDCLAVVAAL